MSFIDSLVPEMAEAIAPLPETLNGGLTLLENRKNTNDLLAEIAKQLPPFEPSPNIDISNETVPGPEGAPDVLVRVYQPKRAKGQTLPAILWMHLGGFFLGSVYMDDALCQRYALEVGCVVVSVEYRLIPEHPYPAAIEDCYAALTWLANSAEQLGVDPSRIAVGGISSGANLAAGLALLARDRGGPALSLQYLNIPALDDRAETPSSSLVLNDQRIWNSEIAVRMWRTYLSEVEGETPIYAAPSRAEDVSNLPTAYIVVAEQDLLRDEAIIYAHRLMQAGVNTELHVMAGTFHGAVVLAPQTSIVQRQLEEEIKILRQLLNTTPV